MPVTARDMRLNRKGMVQTMDETMSTRRARREDHSAYQIHAVAPERITPQCECRVRSSDWNGLHNSGRRHGGAVLDDTSNSRRQVNNLRLTRGDGPTLDPCSKDWVTTALEAVSSALALRDWEYAEILIGQLRCVLRAGGSIAASASSSPSGKPGLDVPSELLVEPLRAREMEVIALVAAGHSNQEIAEQLIVSVGTVRWHLKNIYSKLDVHSRTQAVARVRATGLLN